MKMIIDPLSVTCPNCAEEPGDPCTRIRSTRPHSARTKAARKHWLDHRFDRRVR